MDDRGVLKELFEIRRSAIDDKNSRNPLDALIKVFQESRSSTMLTSVQFCDLLGLALSTPHDLAKSVFHKLSASANGVHPEQVQGSAVDVRRFATGCALSRQDLALSDEQAIEFIFRIHAGSKGEELSKDEFGAAIRHIVSWGDDDDQAEKAGQAGGSQSGADEMWRGGKTETRGKGSKGMKLAAFKSALSTHKVQLPDTSAVFASMPFGGEARSKDVPSCSVNGAEVAMVEVMPGTAGGVHVGSGEGAQGAGGSLSVKVDEGGFRRTRREWEYRHSGSTSVRELDVGLKAHLRKGVQNQGLVVRIQLFDGDVVKESAWLEPSNSYSCRWPDLANNPVTFEKGLVVVMVLMDGMTAEEEDTVMPPPNPLTITSPHELAPSSASASGACGTGRSLAAEGCWPDPNAAHGGGGGMAKRLTVLKREDSAGDSSVGGIGDGSGALKRGNSSELSGGDSKRRVGAAVGSWGAGGKGKGLMHLSVPSPSQGSRARTPLISPLGIHKTRWKLASYTVKLNRHHGTVDNFEMLWQNGGVGAGGVGRGLLGSDDFHASAPHTPRSCPIPDTPNNAGRQSPFSGQNSPRSRGPESPVEQRHGHRGREFPDVQLTRTNSEVPFDVSSAPNQLIEALRFFEMPVPDKNKPAFNWGSQPPAQMILLAKFIEQVARDVRKLCLAEPRCVHVKAPCYILGDLHGNFQDLIAFEKALWRIGPALSPANFLFLGDYVDRGQHSVEVITYLLAQKLMCPGKFILLRGNHETRMQNGFPGYNPCFKDSCCALFGDETGETVWEAVNSVFDTLPLAAVIDNSIFCVHGGIPPASMLNQNEQQSNSGCQGLVSEINRIPREIHQPDPLQGGNPLAWDLMWNDPAPSANLPEGSVGSDGFGPNVGRGTGHMFTAEALDSFLKTYGFSHLVRAHEVRKQGFQVQQHARMVTLFSSSGYCGAGNEACCILACEGKMRFIRLEHHQQPKIGSLASRAAAAGAFAAAMATGNNNNNNNNNNKAAAGQAKEEDRAPGVEASALNENKEEQAQGSKEEQGATKDGAQAEASDENDEGVSPEDAVAVGDADAGESVTAKGGDDGKEG